MFDLYRIAEAIREQDDEVQIDRHDHCLDIDLICNGAFTVWDNGEISTDYLSLRTSADHQLMRAVLDAIEAQRVEQMQAVT